MDRLTVLTDDQRAVGRSDRDTAHFRLRTPAWRGSVLSTRKLSEEPTTKKELCTSGVCSPGPGRSP